MLVPAPEKRTVPRSTCPWGWGGTGSSKGLRGGILLGLVGPDSAQECSYWTVSLPLPIGLRPIPVSSLRPFTFTKPGAPAIGGGISSGGVDRRWNIAPRAAIYGFSDKVASEIRRREGVRRCRRRM